MVVAETVSLASGLMVITNESLELGMRNLVQRQAINMSYVENSVCKSTFTNMVPMPHLKVIPHTFYVYRTCF
jgi:hypothetical protein